MMKLVISLLWNIIVAFKLTSPTTCVNEDDCPGELVCNNGTCAVNNLGAVCLVDRLHTRRN